MTGFVVFLKIYIYIYIQLYTISKVEFGRCFLNFSDNILCFFYKMISETLFLIDVRS